MSLLNQATCLLALTLLSACGSEPESFSLPHISYWQLRIVEHPVDYEHHHYCLGSFEGPEPAKLEWSANGATLATLNGTLSLAGALRGRTLTFNALDGDNEWLYTATLESSEAFTLRSAKCGQTVHATRYAGPHHCDLMSPGQEQAVREQLEAQRAEPGHIRYLEFLENENKAVSALLRVWAENVLSENAPGHYVWVNDNWQREATAATDRFEFASGPVVSGFSTNDTTSADGRTALRLDYTLELQETSVQVVIAAAGEFYSLSVTQGGWNYRSTWQQMISSDPEFLADAAPATISSIWQTQLLVREESSPVGISTFRQSTEGHQHSMRLDTEPVVEHSETAEKNRKTEARSGVGTLSRTYTPSDLRYICPMAGDDLLALAPDVESELGAVVWFPMLLPPE